MAKDLGFMKRNRKINAYNLIESVLFSKFETDKMSLTDHCTYMLVHKGIIVSKQSIDERFNNKSITFIKRLLEQTLQEELVRPDNFPLLDNFPKVRIKDAVSFQLPEHLKDDYPGSGGAGSKAMLKIQFEYDLLTRQVLELQVTAFTKNDSSNAHETVDKIGAGELVVRDLGYISIKNMKAIAEDKGAYYLNRLKFSTIVFKKVEGKTKRCNFSKIETKMRKQNIHQMETKAYIGEEQKYPVRMIIRLVPEKVREERVRERRKYAKRKKQTVNNEVLARCGLNIFITNACEDLMPIGLVSPIYGIRWQIENIFKVWKSVGSIHKIKKMSKYRFEFYLYAKLIFLVKSWNLMRFLELFLKENLSYYKFMKMVAVSGFDQLGKLMQTIVSSVKINNLIAKEFRRGRINEKSIKTTVFNCITTI